MAAKNPTTIRLEGLELTPDSKQFFARLTDSFEHLLNADAGSFLRSLPSTLTNDDSNGRRAMQLVHNALCRAMLTVIIDRPERRQMLAELQNGVIHQNVLMADLHKELIGENVDNRLFSDPEQLPLIKKAQQHFQKWLHKIANFTEHQAAVMASLLPSQFANELFVEFNNGQTRYQQVFDFFENPYLTALEKAARLKAYHAGIMDLFHLPVPLTPSILLSELYIDPDFRIFIGCKNDHDQNSFYGEKEAFEAVKHKGGIHAWLTNWLKNKPSLNAPAEEKGLLLLLGQPGQGKTSFCKKAIVQVLETQPAIKQAVYFQRLVDFRTGEVEQLLRNPLDAVAAKLAGILDDSREPLPKNAFNNSLLILDGFDELYMAQGLSIEDVRSFLNNLKKEVESSTGLHIILTSRYNYVSLNEISHHKCLVLALENLSLSQQQAWLKRYKKLSNEPCKLDNAKLKEIADGEGKDWEELQSLVNQPILLHMMAAIDCEITNKDNRSKIYKELFDKLIGRKWSKEKLEVHTRLKENDFRYFLQDLALFIFQSKNGYADYHDFAENQPLHRPAKELLRKIGLEDRPIKDALKYLLIAFYFNEKPKTEMRPGDRDEFAVEFLHKSFMEYLVAEKIWRYFSKEFGGDNDLQWEEVLRKIHKLFSKKIISAEVVWYLKDMIESDEDINKKRQLRENLKGWLPKLLEHDFLWKYDAENKPETSPMDAMMACFYGYWTVASLLVEKVEVPNWKDVRSVETYRLLFKDTLSSTNMIPALGLKKFCRFVLTICKSYVETPIYLRYQDLEKGHFEGATLVKVDFEGANLYNANFCSTLFSSFITFEAPNGFPHYARTANMKYVNLSRAFIIFSNLPYMRLNNISLEGAKIFYSNLGGADLSNSNLSNVELFYSNLSFTSFKNSKLNKLTLLNEISQNIQDADFTGTEYENKFTKKKKGKDEEE